MSSIKALTFPHSDPDTKISLTFNVPFCTRIVATEPLPFSSLDSITDPLAFLLGLALRLRRSACKWIASSNLSKFVPLVADTSISKTSPLSFSTITSWLSNSFLTLSGSAPGRSILLIATIIGTSADLFFGYELPEAVQIVGLVGWLSLVVGTSLGNYFAWGDKATSSAE